MSTLLSQVVEAACARDGLDPDDPDALDTAADLALLRLLDRHAPDALTELYALDRPRTGNGAIDALPEDDRLAAVLAIARGHGFSFRALARALKAEGFTLSSAALSQLLRRGPSAGHTAQ